MTDPTPEPSRPQPRTLPGTVVPNYVERRTFRRRRLIDAACALPLLGWILWWLPLFWHGAENEVPASMALIYIFGIWLALGLCAARLVRLIERSRMPEPGTGAEEQP
ncbi:hypothetical protein [Antarctobacter jejuensis]|uniref:hypothetical protein n=1 Tax=Antarctobacter jejuensis TaxID=1439938 RepID=UPI003FCEF63C